MTEGTGVERGEIVYVRTAWGAGDLVYPMAYRPLMEWVADHDARPERVVSGSINVDTAEGTMSFQNFETGETEARPLVADLPAVPGEERGHHR